MTENEPLEIAVPMDVVTWNGPLKLPMIGIPMTICVLVEVATGTVTPLIVTVTCEALVGKPVPEIVTDVALGKPLVGVNPEIVGAEVGLPQLLPVGDWSQH
jgi:hypothetical protein